MLDEVECGVGTSGGSKGQLKKRNCGVVARIETNTCGWHCGCDTRLEVWAKLLGLAGILGQ